MLSTIRFASKPPRAAETGESQAVNLASYWRGEQQPRAPLAAEPLTGIWINTNGAPVGISRIEIREICGSLGVRCFGALLPDPCDWGEVETVPYALTADGEIAAGFQALYEFGTQEALVTAIHNRGVLVIHTYHRFMDESGRANFILKEFFHQ